MIFFFKQKTAYEMRISDWSSDVCSSDLAKLIEHKLLDAVSPEEWAARELRCGDATAFQGSERDVMFLSMVKAPDADKRLSAQTADTYVQRFNVAASRAKDQMWVYHSMPREALTNAGDMRSEEHTSELQSLMRISYAVFCLKK